MKNRRNYYRILQVQPDAPFEVIRGAYRTLMRELRMHPDLGGDHWNAQTLTEAYETLSDASAREAYDKRLFETYTKRPFADGPDGRRPIITVFCPFCKRPMAREAKPHERCESCSSPLGKMDDAQLDEECRRAVSRQSRGGRVRYFAGLLKKGRDAEIVDLSPQGMRLRCAEKLKKNLVLKISGEDLEAIAEVVNCTPAGGGGPLGYEVGLRFVTVEFTQEKGSFYSNCV